MKVVIFGATGRTGHHLVDQALELGHQVRAFVRDPSRIPTRHERLEVMSGDVLDPAAVASAVAGQDAVICAIGPSSLKPTTLTSEGTNNIVRAMETHNVRRFICLTAVGIGDSHGQGGFVLSRIVVPLLLKNVYADKERQEAAVRASTLDWVIVRPTRLLKGPVRGTCRTSLNGTPVGSAIAFADVASFMLAQLTSDQFLGKAPVIGS
jgi:putative NADH-flavin reductase